MAEQDVVEEALLEILLEIGADARIADLEVPGSVPQSGTIDHAVIRHLQRAGHREDRLRRARQPITGSRAYRGYEGQTNRDVADRRGRQTGIEAIGDLHGRRRDNERAVHESRTQEPVEPRAPVEAEGDDKERVDETHHHHDPQKRAEAPSPRPCADGIEDVDDIFAAADRVDLHHGD